MNINNRMYNATNPFQGSYKKVLCVCSAGLLRSPTAAVVLSQPPFKFNTRAAGIEESFALVPVDEVLIHWADHIVCMTSQQRDMILTKFADMFEKPEGYNKGMVVGTPPVIDVLNISDDFAYRDPELIRLIKEKCEKIFQHA